MIIIRIPVWTKRCKECSGERGFSLSVCFTLLEDEPLGIGERVSKGGLQVTTERN